MKNKAWRRQRTSPSLEDVYRTIPVGGRSPGRRLLAFLGPGCLVAVGRYSSSPRRRASARRCASPSSVSQVVLSLPLSFAVIPLVRFTSDRFKMGEFANPWWLAALAWIVAVIIASLNGWLLAQMGMGWLER